MQRRYISTIFCKQILPNARCLNNYWIWCVQRQRERVCFQLCFVVLASVKNFGRFCSFLSISCTHTCIRAATAAEQDAPRAIDQPNYWTFVVNVGHFECVKIETIYFTLKKCGAKLFGTEKFAVCLVRFLSPLSRVEFFIFLLEMSHNICYIKLCTELNKFFFLRLNPNFDIPSILTQYYSFT